jgi:hypothetical protein
VTRIDPIDRAAARADELPSRGALSYPSYRRFWFASLVFIFAIQFRFIGAGWLVHQLTDSPFWLGVPGIISAVVTILLTVPAGALADRVDTQRLLVAGRAQSAILPRLIDRRAMASAVALTSSIWNGMRVIGPAAAGLLIAAVGIGQAFVVTGVGYVISAVMVATIALEPLRTGDADADGGGVFAGVRYVFGNGIFLATIGLSFLSSIFGHSYVVLLPIFSDEILHAGVQGFGYMEAAAGVGALLGTLSIVRLRIQRHTGGVMVGAAVLFGLCIAAFAGSRSLALSMGLLFVGAFFSSVYLNLGMTTLQLLVPDALRGRVMGVWGLTWFLTSAGGFAAASIAEFLGAPFAVALGALSVSAFAVVVYLSFSELRNLAPPV